MKTLKEILSKNVRALREGSQMKQADLADKAGVARQVIVNIEGGNVWPDYATIQAVAGALDVKEVRLMASDSTDTVAIIEKLNDLEETLKKFISGLTSPARAELLGAINDIPDKRLGEALLFIKTMAGDKAKPVTRKALSKVANR